MRRTALRLVGATVGHNERVGGGHGGPETSAVSETTEAPTASTPNGAIVDLVDGLAHRAALEVGGVDGQHGMRLRSRSGAVGHGS